MYACLALVLCQAHHHLALSLQRLTAMCTAKLPFSPFEKNEQIQIPHRRTNCILCFTNVNSHCGATSVGFALNNERKLADVKKQRPERPSFPRNEIHNRIHNRVLRFLKSSLLRKSYRFYECFHARQ